MAHFSMTDSGIISDNLSSGNGSHCPTMLRTRSWVGRAAATTGSQYEPSCSNSTDIIQVWLHVTCICCIHHCCCCCWWFIVWFHSLHAFSWLELKAAFCVSRLVLLVLWFGRIGVNMEHDQVCDVCLRVKHDLKHWPCPYIANTDITVFLDKGAATGAVREWLDGTEWSACSHNGRSWTREFRQGQSNWRSTHSG